MHLGQTRQFCWPIVHLDVDVRMDIRAPRSVVRVVPNALEVVGQVDASGTGDKEVATVGKVELLQLSGFGRTTQGYSRRQFRVVIDQLVRGFGAGSSIKIQAAAIEVWGVVGQMIRKQSLPRLGSSGVQRGFYSGGQLISSANESWGNGVVVCACGNQYKNLVSPRHIDIAILGNCYASLGNHLHAGSITDCFQFTGKVGLAAFDCGTRIVGIPELETLAEHSGFRSGQVDGDNLIGIRDDVLPTEGD